MMKNMYYQCRMRKGNRITTSFIPARFAEVGRVVKLKENDEWDDGWRVLSVGSAMSAEQLKAQEQRQRKGMPSLQKG